MPPLYIYAIWKGRVFLGIIQTLAIRLFGYSNDLIKALQPVIGIVYCIMKALLAYLSHIKSTLHHIKLQ